MSKVVKVKKHKAGSAQGLKVKQAALPAPAEPQVAEAVPSKSAAQDVPQPPVKDIPTEVASASQPETPATSLGSTASASTPEQFASTQVPGAGGDASSSPVGQFIDAWTSSLNPNVFKSLLAFGGALALVNMQSSGSSVSTPPIEQKPEPSSSDGRAIDGYLANALVWRDTNGNQSWDAGEPYA